MKIEQTRWTSAEGWDNEEPGYSSLQADLVLVFGDKSLLQENQLIAQIRTAYTDALITGCSTAGEICGTRVTDNSLVVTAIQFEHTTAHSSMVKVDNAENSYRSGKELAQSIPHDNLAHVFVLSDGLNVNGSELVAGLTDHLPKNLTVTGGLSGDGDRFENTVVLWEDTAQTNSIVLVVSVIAAGLEG